MDRRCSWSRPRKTSHLCRFVHPPSFSRPLPPPSLPSQVLPESCILILFGILLGFACYEIEVETSPAGSSLRKALVEKDASFSLDSKTFFFYLLPPIVLDAG